MSGISGVAGGAFAAAAEIEKSAPKRAEPDHGRDRSSERTAEIQKSDKKEQSRALDIHV